MKILNYKKFQSIARFTPQAFVVLLSVGAFVMPELVYAQAATPASTSGLMSIFGFSFEHFFNPLLASLGYTALIISTVFLRISAALLDQAIYSTLHIAELVANVPAIETVWKIIRDFSSIFLIFMLLYSAITMILGLDTQGFRKLVINIVLAGLLINFSLFFTKLAIDTSNVVALSFYKAIDAAGDKSKSVGVAQNLLSSSNGLSNGVMQGMRIQTLLVLINGKSDEAFGGYKNGVDFKIVIVTVMGTVIVFIAALSFLAAAVMFAMRIAILILLMAFSPLYFVGMVIPAIQPKAKEWATMLLGQCIFAPLYLMLMYVVLRVINDDGFGKALGLTGDAQTDAFSGAILTGKSVGVVIVYIMIILMINMALAASKEYAGKAGELGMKAHGLAQKYSKKWGMAGAQYVSTNTTGRVMSKLSESESFKSFAASSKLGEIALKGVRKAGGGYNKQLDAQVKARTEFADTLGHDQVVVNAAQAHLRNLQSDLAAAKAAGTPTKDLNDAIAAAKKNITNIENKRKQNFATRTNKRSADTVYSKIARKDKVAAAKVQIPILEDELTHHKDELKTTKDDIKQLQNAIRNNPAGTGTEIVPGMKDVFATKAQLDRLNSLRGDEVKHTGSVNEKQADIDMLKLVK